MKFQIFQAVVGSQLNNQKNNLPMEKYLKPFIVSAYLFICTAVLSAQYTDHQSLSARVKAMGRENPALCKIRSLIKTAGGKDIWLITIGTGTTEEKPGIAIIAGVEGSYLLGKELALGFASGLLRNSADKTISDLLGKVTFYILPDVSPDATEQYFLSPEYERNINNNPYDDDRDFNIDEDPCEDLNNDGLISIIRIADPSGQFIESVDDKRVMVEADLSKGETGKYLVYSEGIDNDKDGSFNEDGEGGVNFNRNFTFNYEEFGLNAGPYPVSEPETRAVADFLFDHFNIFATIAFGPQDNLGQSAEISSGKGDDQNQLSFRGCESDQEEPDRRITSVLKEDAVINRYVSDRYHEITGAQGAPPARSSPGNFMEWAYYHYGRYSFSTPGWWFPAEKGVDPEVAFLKFADKNKVGDVFIPWTEIAHPDFPGKKTEVGGIKPFVMINPPADTVQSLIKTHFDFITAVAAMHPELEFLDVKTEKMAGDLFRISLKVYNKGIFATCAKIGEQNLWTRVMRLAVELSKGQSVVSGMKVQRIKRLDGDESAEFSWLISGKGQLGISAGALNTGIIKTKLELR